jgi:hypothetical protein
MYIDEAGNFVTPPPKETHSYSLVLALAIPSAIEAELFYEFLRLRDGWPVKVIEIKGSQLDESQAAEVIDLVSRYDVLVNFCAIDMATHTDGVARDFKLRQADALTANLTPEHHPNIVTQFHKDAVKLRSMSNQLFLQAFLTIQLVLEVIQEAILYYVQSVPEELGEIAWFIDPKDRTITQMEELWTTYILPMGENHFLKKPLIALQGADYSHFDARYGFTADTVDAEMARHLDWLQQVFGVDPLAGGKSCLDAKLLLSEKREFPDSRDSLGIQLADMLATILRRALNNRLQYSGWKDFGKLLVTKAKEESYFLQLGPAGGSRQAMKGHAKEVALALIAQAKPMVLD